MTEAEKFRELISHGRRAFNNDAGYHEWVAAVEALATSLASEAAADMRQALANLVAACDAGRMVSKPGCGAGGMTIEANIRASNINGVSAWAVEEARAVLDALPDSASEGRGKVSAQDRDFGEYDTPPRGRFRDGASEGRGGGDAKIVEAAKVWAAARRPLLKASAIHDEWIVLSRAEMALDEAVGALTSPPPAEGG